MMVTLTKIPSSNANFVETFEDPLLDILLKKISFWIFFCCFTVLVTAIYGIVK